MSLEARRISVAEGVELEVVDHGSGPAVLFLHGFTDSWYSFSPVIERMPSGVRSIAPSQRGHGGSSKPRAAYSIPDFAADAAALLDALEVPSAVVVGHSMGSLVAQQLALDHPTRVSRLVLVGSATSFDNPGVRGLEQTVAELGDTIPRELAVEFQAGTLHRPVPAAFFERVVAESLRVPAPVWRAAMDGILAYSPRERLVELALPVLLVWGDRDTIALRDEQTRLCEAIRGAELLTYAETGHAPHWEDPERFLDDLLAFAR